MRVFEGVPSVIWMTAGHPDFPYKYNLPFFIRM